MSRWHGYDDISNVIIYRYEELSKLVEDNWNSYPDDVKHQKIEQTDISFDDIILSSTKEGDIIEIDYDEYTYKVIGRYTWIRNN